MARPLQPDRPVGGHGGGDNRHAAGAPPLHKYHLRRPGSDARYSSLLHRRASI